MHYDTLNTIITHLVSGVTHIQAQSDDEQSQRAPEGYHKKCTVKKCLRNFSLGKDSCLVSLI